DVPPNRFAAAMGQARDLLGHLPEGSSFTLIEAGRRPRVLATDQQNPGEALRAIDQLRPSNAGADVDEALRLGVALAGDRPHRHLYLVSDGAFKSAALPDLHDTPFSYL